MKAHRHAVVNRSNSRNCGEIDAEVTTKTPGNSRFKDRFRAFLVRRIEIGEQKADRDRLDPFRFQSARRRDHTSLVERLKLLAVRRNEPALHHLAVAPLDQRPALPRQFLHDRVVLGALMPRDMDNVAEAFVGQHAGAGAFVLQHGIGRSRRAVQHVVDVARGDTVVAADFGDALDDGAGRVVGRGRDFVDGDLAGIQIAIHDIGEGATDIDPDRFHNVPACMLPLVAFA